LVHTGVHTKLLQFMGHTVEAMQQVTQHAHVTATPLRDIAIIAGCVVVALASGAATLRRRTA